MAEEEPKWLCRIKLVLASTSPRRREILKRAGIPFEVRISGADEAIGMPLAPPDFVQALARRKAQAVDLHPGETILGADTVVTMDERILGKPQNKQEAIEMLTALSGRTHTVYTGVCLRTERQTVCFSEATQVRFYQLTASEIKAYVDTGEPMDKAGAYGIQDRGSLFVHSIQGDYFNVMGLPVSRIFRHLQALEFE